MNNPYISICIPAYKNKAFLERLLNSIKIQSYKNFEVVITDDSPDNEIFELCEQFKSHFDLIYHKNPTNLNTPENWNEAVRKAKHEWIKIIHDDDWFVNSDSLYHFAKAIKENPTHYFFFSAYQNSYFDSGRILEMHLSRIWRFLLQTDPEVLVSKNVIGPPSVTLYRKTMLDFDRNMKYVVDIDFYTQYLCDHHWIYIPTVLINVGIHSSQVTKYTFGISEYHFKESILMLLKKDDTYFRNLAVFDGWWRLLRNFEVSSTEKFSKYNIPQSHLHAIETMIDIQNLLSKKSLKNGFFSKTTMFISYLKFLITKN